jgi:hypothetical protein
MTRNKNTIFINYHSKLKSQTLPPGKKYQPIIIEQKSTLKVLKKKQPNWLNQ